MSAEGHQLLLLPWPARSLDRLAVLSVRSSQWLSCLTHSADPRATRPHRPGTLWRHPRLAALPLPRLLTIPHLPPCCSYVYLVDSIGRVRWRGSGRPDERELATLLRCTQELLES